MILKEKRLNMAGGGQLNQNNPNQMQSMGAQGGQQYSPMQPAQQPFNVNQAAAGGLQQAMQGTQQAMQGTNIGQFMNPYTQKVTQNTLAEMERQRKMAMKTKGAQA